MRSERAGKLQVYFVVEGIGVGHSAAAPSAHPALPLKTSTKLIVRQAVSADIEGIRALADGVSGLSRPQRLQNCGGRNLTDKDAMILVVLFGASERHTHFDS